MKNIAPVLLVFLAVVAIGCDEPVAQQQQTDEPVADEQQADEPSADIEYRWLPDDDAEKFQAIENQLGGFSATMEEVAYRYNELYWAGRDRNWDYADYQLDKLAGSIEDGIIRRPARAASARDFLDDDVPALDETITNEDAEGFDDQIDQFVDACNTCHAREAVPFIEVTHPETRVAPVAPQPPLE